MVTILFGIDLFAADIMASEMHFTFSSMSLDRFTFSSKLDSCKSSRYLSELASL